jgi:DNA polymerase elongation subunit (family B)
MEFYTSVVQYGSKMLVRGYDTKGNQFKHRVDFQPTIFIPSKNPTEYKTLENKFVAPLQAGSMKETREYIDRYKEIEGFEIYGNNNFVAQFISDNYREEIIPDTDKIKIFTIDIETATEEGFPDIQSANEEILLITLQDNKTKDIITFGRRPIGNAGDVDYRLYENETQMLREFLMYWQDNCPDVVTGWNINFFDIPYLIRRIQNLLGESFAKKMSPWDLISERRVQMKGSEELTYDIQGVAMLDYLDLYKKYTYQAQESYRLDHIALVELGDKKLDHSEYGSFKDFYTQNWKKFVAYNIHDVQLVDKLEDKMKLIELQLVMAYNAKINYEDVFSQVRMWDAIIYNHLRDRGIVIPQNSGNRKYAQFEGAYVKDPLVGLHKWVASFDLNSLYPHLIMQYNISPEMMLEGRETVTVDHLLEQKFDNSEIKARNVSMTANGVCYSKDKQGFMPELMQTMYINRSKFKKQMLNLQQEYEHDKTNNNLRKEISRLNNLQMAMKIALNSAYGAMGNQYFRYFDLRMAEGITTSGQLSIRWMANKLNDFMNKTLKTTKRKDFVIAIDTDSIYLTLETLVESVCAGKTDEQKIKYMDKICEDIFQPFIDKGYQELADYMNAYDQKMQMKREVLADKAIWTAKKRYIMNVHNSEGVQYAEPKIKVMGLEMVKSSTPQVIRNKLKDSIKVILEGDQSKLHRYIHSFRDEFNKLPVEEIAFPRSVNGLKEYAAFSTIYRKSTPIHVRGALLLNHHLKQMNLDRKYQPIRDGDKIKFVYLKTPNTIQEDIISFSQELPKELDLHKYVNYEKQFEKVFLDALQIVIEPLGWKVEEHSSLEDFFG